MDMEYRIDKMLNMNRELNGEERRVDIYVEGTIDLSSCSSRRSIVVPRPRYDEEQEEPTDLSNKSKKQDEDVKSLRKHKPIPPPLVLNNNQNPSLVSHIQIQQSPNNSSNLTPSPKNLPLPFRKRWHSCSLSMAPINGQQEEPSMVPLQHPDANTIPRTGLTACVETHAPQQNQYHHHLPPYNSPGVHGHTYTTSGRWLEFVPISTPTPTTTSPPTRVGQLNGHQHAQAHSGTTSNGDLQTPTPFYTPNEPSPKFMNSPVFSYSSPDTALYQGPFSPIRASALYPPPSSPFTNLSLNSPLLPLSTSSGSGGGSGGGGSHGSVSTTPISSMSSSSSNSSCFNNMIPSTLLSPAPSQASTNSLSYEDLQEKSLYPPPVSIQPSWSIFLSGTKVRFVTGMTTSEWYPVDFLAQNAESLGLKGDFAQHGLEVRKFIVTSSAKERIQLTFVPIGDPTDPHIEANCEPGHPFVVDKKGWCAVKPEVFQEIYGTQCQPLECLDVCLGISTARSPNQNQNQSQSQYQIHQPQQQHHITTFNHNGSNGIHTIIKMEPVDEKPVPVSVLQHAMQSPPPHLTINPTTGSPNNNNRGTNSTMNANVLNSRKTFASPMSNAATPAKKAKESKPKKQNNTNANVENKGRRPMNGFLLFAKDKRPELIQQYPGKDNRSISVLLGEAWQTLDPAERDRYSQNAKIRADEHKKLHPDCWKRKRSQSINS